MEQSTRRCPRCNKHHLRIVGGYVYTTTGVVESESFSIVDLNVPDAFVTQKLYACQNCQAHMPESEVKQGEERAQQAIRWETNTLGRPIPLVCPECKNAIYFVRESLALLEQATIIKISEEGTVEVVQNFLPEEPRETITILYRCGNTECRGVVQVNVDTFTMRPLS